MAKKIFLAGATGAVGLRMLPLLRAAGYEVTGTTRVAYKAEELRAAGIIPAMVDVFDAAALKAAVAAARPEVIVHQLTDLPHGLKAELMAEGLVRNARLRIEGTRNLVDAALGAGARRFIAQSIAFVYAPGREPHDESDPLISPAEEPWRCTMEGVMTLERLATSTPGLEGIVLRYGMFYGPGTGFEVAPGKPAVHVDAAAKAAMLAIESGAPGVYNIAEDGGGVSTVKAHRELGWASD
ncbi:MAG TPA: NAD(P)-dependent oxidoreductase [Candidatus Binataceae bacterium]|nr:NAD(P)-dependent oxidoreductase [Candidatus Binataceae bacterium]